MKKRPIAALLFLVLSNAPAAFAQAAQSDPPIVISGGHSAPGAFDSEPPIIVSGGSPSELPADGGVLSLLGDLLAYGFSWGV